MEVWIWDTLMWPYDGRRAAVPFPLEDYDDNRIAHLYDDHLRFAVTADALGIDGICTAEHHAGAAGFCPSPNLWATAVAIRTERIRIGTLGNVLPMYGHPLRLAEELAMVDVYSKGRLTCGFIPGGGTQVKAFAIPLDELRSRFEEAFELVLKAWSAEEPFDWEGRHFQYREAAVYPRPLQKPYPPVVSVGRSAESLDFSARHRLPLTCSFASSDDAQALFSAYDHAAAAYRWEPGPAFRRLCRLVYVARSREEARREAETHILTYMAESLATRGVYPVQLRRAQERNLPLLDQLCDSGIVILGDPDAVSAQIIDQQRRLQFGTLLLGLPFATLPVDRAVASLQLFAREVLPGLKA